MNQEEFKDTLAKLTPRRREVLEHLLTGETDAKIAEFMRIEEATVRKHIEKICESFIPDKQHLGKRQYKRTELVALFAQYKPKLLNESIFKNVKKVNLTETVEITEKSISQTFDITQIQTNDTEQSQEEKYQLWLQNLSSTNPNHELIKHIKENCNEQEKQEFANLLNRVGLQCYLEINLQKAAFLLQLAIDLNPSFLEAHYNIGLVYEALYICPSAHPVQNYLEKARHHYYVASFERIKNLATFAAINNLSRLLIIEGNSQNQAAAIVIIESILSQVEDDNIKASLLKNLGWAYFEDGKYNQAKQNLLKSLELDPNYAPAHCLLAKVQELEGEHENALASWKKFLESYSHKQQEQKLYQYLPELKIWQLDARKAVNSEDR